MTRGDDPYEHVLTPPARRALTEHLPEAVAGAVIESLTTALVHEPFRVGKRYAASWPGSSRHAAARTGSSTASVTSLARSSCCASNTAATHTAQSERLYLVAAPTGILLSYFSATLTRTSDRLALTGETVTFSVSGQVICSATTDAKGQAACAPLISLFLGPSSCAAGFSGDRNDLAASGSGKFT